MALGLFLCGCPVGPREGYPRRYLVRGRDVVEYNMEQNDFQDAVEVCPEHGELPYGYLSPKVRHSAGHQVLDWSGHRLGRERPISSAILAAPDKRDNRDPSSLEVQEELQAALREIRARHNGQ